MDQLIHLVDQILHLHLVGAAIGKSDQGEHSEVTAGKNINGFISLMEELVRGNGSNPLTSISAAV
ncbi:MAG: hypothetical protein IPK32_02485 [Verrucomicrobiaceae bacterium]|nr:hypothetical protein [Verrucomicrobiaceae bacterium]